MGVDNTYCIVFVLSLVLFLASMEQASAIFYIPTEITQVELTESYIQQEIFRLEQLRNEIYGSLQNPYDDIEIEQKTNNQILDYYSPNSSDYFPKVIEYFNKVQQINLASQQLDEILRGKSITNSDFYESSFIMLDTSKFLVDNQTVSLDRTDEDFQNYIKEQIMISEKIRNDRYHLNQENFNENVYQLSDEELKTYEKPLKNFETTSKKVKEQKQQANEQYESQIEKLNNTFSPKIGKETKNYETQIETLDKDFNKLIEFELQIFEKEIKILTEESPPRLEFRKLMHKTKINALSDEFNTEKQDVKTAYKIKIKELTDELNTKKQDVKIPYQIKMTKLNEELITSEQKIPKLIAIKLKNDEKAISNYPTHRGDSEFKNLIKNEILLAEKTRDNIIALNDTDALNPYIIENTINAAILIENAINPETAAHVETEKIYLVLSWSDQNVVLELQATTLNRNSTNFEDFKLMQAELAQMQLNKMLRVENSENTEPSDSEQTDIVINDYPYLNSYDRNDFLFKFNKNMQKIMAEKKFIELFGNEIQNKDFDKRD